ncbi:DpnD/PcfM family protein [Neisseria sp. CCUG12390]|uniref:DpnD/PcfM family protein n=1 Tax=Neisseria sp. CCUG12390 TaxID=3392035 RepID=UPI003A0FC7CE
MALFEIEVREVFSRNVIIEAETVSDALDETKEKYECEEIVLDVDDLISQDFFPADSLISKVSLPDEYIEHLKLVVAYLEADEQKHYESSNFPKKHIFHSVLALKNILEIRK